MKPAITAGNLQAPPPWALLQRELFDFMAEAVRYAAGRYGRPDGTPLNAQDADDAYEAHSYRGLFYALGASDDIGELAFRQWEGITRLYDDAGEPPHGMGSHPKYDAELHAEYYKHGDWFHMGEGNQSFYSLGLADPHRPAHLERVRRFADLYLGDSPARNYDTAHRVIRSPFHGSTGPLFHAELEFVKRALDPIYYPGGVARGHAQRANLHPLIPGLEENWFECEPRRREVCQLFDAVVMQGDIPDNLGCTGLLTNAFLHTGDERYRQWVLDYTEAWMERILETGGIIPDNVGLNGAVGARRNGQWWGGWYGWNCYKGNNIGLTSMTVGAECAHLLSGDDAYLQVIRSQMEVMLANAHTLDDGQLVVSWRHGPDGWFDYQPMPIKWLPHVYHASMNDADRQMMERVREGDVGRDWSELGRISAKSGGEWAFFQYHSGKFPDWPEQLMVFELAQAEAALARVSAESREPDQMIADNSGIPNPVSTEALTQMMLGAPGTVYNGGLLRATVRYFDPERARPGLPEDVAALVDGLGRDRVTFHLVNLNRHQTRRIVVQAGAFGEHRFDHVQYVDGDRDRDIAVAANYLEVALPPGTSIHLRCGLDRFTNRPSYALPWHGE